MSALVEIARLMDLDAREASFNRHFANPPLVGVCPVPEAPEPCYLAEMSVPTGDVDAGEITQPDPTRPSSDWQVPWDEQVLSETDEGATLVFFFHYVDPSIPLTTLWGDVALPAPSPRPDRLAGIAYEEP